ncbi:splicing factor 3B subunit 4-like [Sus scrofa]|uniref:splicing factor 3B subunit 4-like n=1 Tax=Sus scrofa TaxID=9823 RepID=UPI000A2B465E|nr:splicing factor 3B subunit 4-like [Sus scrofa]
MAPPAPLARSLGLGADPPGRTPPSGSRRPGVPPPCPEPAAVPSTPEGTPGIQHRGSPGEVATGGWPAVARGSPTRRCSFDTVDGDSAVLPGSGSKFTQGISVGIPNPSRPPATLPST